MKRKYNVPHFVRKPRPRKYFLRYELLSNYQGLPRLRRRDWLGRGSTGSVSSSAPPPLRAPLPEASRVRALLHVH